MTSDPVDALETAAAERRSAEAAVQDVGQSRVDRVTDAYDRFDDLLSRYREPASGSGAETFRAYVDFEGKLADFVEALPDDLLHRDAFEAAESVLDRRRLEERDFDRARDELAPVREVADLVEERETAAERYREARHAVKARRRQIDAEVDEMEAVLAFDDVDFDAPVEAIEEPILAYEDAVDDAFRAFASTASARDVLDVVDTTSAYPLVDFPEPPDELRRYLHDGPAGEEPISTLLDWADYSRSKVAHYVDDPAEFQVHVGGNRTYLARLSAEPLHVGWPPPPAGTLRFRARELVAVAERFAPESTVERLHAVRAAARNPDYEALRRTAVARAELTDEQRRRLRDGTIHGTIESLRGERGRLSRALSTHPVH